MATSAAAAVVVDLFRHRPRLLLRPHLRCRLLLRPLLRLRRLQLRLATWGVAVQATWVLVLVTELPAAAIRT